MKQKKNLSSILVVILIMVISFAGCGTNNTKNAVNNKSGEKVNMKDIDWSVDDGIIDSKRSVLFNYKNNTPYTITELNMTFKEKASITDEDKAKFYSYFEDVGRTMGQKEDEIQKDLQQIKKLPLSIKAEVEKIVKPGESAKNINFTFFSGYMEVKDINLYNLLEPDIATIKYIDDSKIFTMYYDFASKKYTTEENTDLAYEWYDTTLSSKIIKPDAQLVKNISNSDSTYSFIAYGFSLQQFNTYIEECKKLGYTAELNFKNNYDIKNSEGYEADLSYDEEKQTMDVHLYSPKK